ncbi:transglutaminase-like domain-containing protein [Methanoculleus taiwanensis]|uniref:transglutaminase-like domain-containing protein n=1 Tax=Methanoculleus taiwanensis TaxID=1550565 RepID=UPI001F4F47D8|nr:transglutaminase-like domain-containing protein [Methanoculleus taiwanensis]
MSLLSAILLISLITPQGVLICPSIGLENAGSPPDATVPTAIAAVATPGAPPDEIIRRVETETRRYIDGRPRLFPVGIDTTLKNRIGDCTDLALLRVEILNENGVKARPVHGIMIWDTKRFKSAALHLEFRETAVAIHDWVEIDGGRTLGAYEGRDEIRCVKIGDGVCLQPIFQLIGYL